MAKFSIGEIAILAAHPESGVMPLFDKGVIGREVEVISDPYRNTCFGNAVFYDIQAPWLPRNPNLDFHAWCAAEACLIKRRPPPDWNALSNPLDVPQEELV